MSVPDSVLFGHSVLGVGAGIWERTKGLLNHHIAAATNRDTLLFPSEWDCGRYYHSYSCLSPLERFSCLSCS